MAGAARPRAGILCGVQSDAIRSLGDIEDRHWWFAERRSLIRSQVEGVRPVGPALDVGAAAGGNTRVLVEAGWDCVALEYSQMGADMASERGLTVVRGDATKLPIADYALGLVVAYDVLEHIEDDVAAAREFFRCLRPGGQLLVAVPADMRLWSAHDEAVDHVRRYERDELLALIDGRRVQGCDDPVVERAVAAGRGDATQEGSGQRAGGAGAGRRTRPCAGWSRWSGSCRSGGCRGSRCC